MTPKKGVQKELWVEVEVTGRLLVTLALCGLVALAAEMLIRVLPRTAALWETLETIDALIAISLTASCGVVIVGKSIIAGSAELVKTFKEHFP